MSTTARHARPQARSARGPRRALLALLWLAAVVAAYFGIVGASTKYGCAAGRHDFACRTSGSITGVVLVGVAALVLVVVITATAHAGVRRTVAVGTGGVLLLAACAVYAAFWLQV